MSFTVDARDEGDGVRFDVTYAGKTASYLTEGRESRHYFEFFRRLHQDFGTRLPHFFVDRRDFADTPQSWQPLLTDNVSPQILAGYGDPAVLKTAYNAFKKRWKLTRLDYESRIGKSPLSGGGRNSIVGIEAPREFPKAVWEELAKQGRLKRAGSGLYSMP